MDRLEKFFLANGLFAKTQNDSIVGIESQNPDAELEYHISDGFPNYVAISQEGKSSVFCYSS